MRTVSDRASSVPARTVPSPRLTANCTSRPDNGLPMPSVTRTISGLASAWPTVPVWPLPSSSSTFWIGSLRSVTAISAPPTLPAASVASTRIRFSPGCNRWSGRTKLRFSTSAGTPSTVTAASVNAEPLDAGSM